MHFLLVSLALGTVPTAPVPYGTHQFSLLSSSRAISHDTQIAQMLFAGSGHARNSHVMIPPRDVRTADRFRRDTEAVWAQSTNSVWFVLKPQLLGRARQVSENAYCEACISSKVIMMTDQVDAARPAAY